MLLKHPSNLPGWGTEGSHMMRQVRETPDSPMPWPAGSQPRQPASLTMTPSSPPRLPCRIYQQLDLRRVTLSVQLLEVQFVT